LTVATPTGRLYMGVAGYTSTSDCEVNTNSTSNITCVVTETERGHYRFGKISVQAQARLESQKSGVVGVGGSYTPIQLSLRDR